MRPSSPAGTSALKARLEREAVRSRGEGTGLEPVPEAGIIPTAEAMRGRGGVNDTDVAAIAEAARVRYRKVFACSAGDSPDEEHS
jgi:hypothetical protein